MFLDLDPAQSLQHPQRPLQIDRVVRHGDGKAFFEAIDAAMFFGIQAHRRRRNLHDTDQVSFVALVIGFQKDTVLHHVGIDVAFENGAIGFQTGAEFVVFDLVAFFLQLGLNANLEFVDVRSGDKADTQFRFLRCCGCGVDAEQ